MEYSSSLREIAGPLLVCLPLSFDPKSKQRTLGDGRLDNIFCKQTSVE